MTEECIQTVTNRPQAAKFTQLTDISRTFGVVQVSSRLHWSDECRMLLQVTGGRVWKPHM